MNTTIVEQVNAYLKQGYTKGQITKALLDKGLNKNEIDTIIKNSREQPQNTTGPNKKRIISLITCVIVLLLLTALAYNLFTDKQPQTAKDYLREGRDTFRAGHHEKSLEYLSKSLELDPYDYQAYRMLGIVYFTNEDYQKALDYYLKARDLNPNDPQVHRALGWTYLKLKRYPPALVEFNKTLTLLSPDYVSFLQVNNSAYIGIKHVCAEYSEPSDYCSPPPS